MGVEFFFIVLICEEMDIRGIFACFDSKITYKKITYKKVHSISSTIKIHLQSTVSYSERQISCC